jgi:hypothetical protein
LLPVAFYQHAVPGTLRPAALGLLLGIARHAAIPIAGLVDSAVAATAGLEARATVLHLDVQLHQAVLTELHGTNLLRRRRVEVTPRAGQKALFAGWAIAWSTTISSTRSALRWKAGRCPG